MSERTVIVPYARSLMALVVGRSLGQRAIPVEACDSVDFTALSFSRFARDSFICPDYRNDPDGFTEGLKAHCRKLAEKEGRAPLVMPVYTETAILSDRRAEFDGVANLILPPREAFDAVRDKLALAKTAKECGANIPQIWTPESEDELDDALAEMQFPVMIKPADASGGRGIFACDDGDSVKQRWRENRKRFDQPQLIQAKTKGTDYCFAALYQGGVRKASMAYHNLRQFPEKTGAGSLRETVDDTPFRDTADRLMHHIGWNGVAQFDFMWTGDAADAPVLIEVNARFWGGLFQSFESGVDFPWLLYRHACGETLDVQPDARTGKRTRLPLIWAWSVLRDEIARDDGHFDGLEDQGRRALESLRAGEGFGRLRDFAGDLAKAVGGALDVGERVQRVSDALETGSDAQSEFGDPDDPVVPLGVLFVLGSLIRHGRLPPEVRH